VALGPQGGHVRTSHTAKNEKKRKIKSKIIVYGFCGKINEERENKQKHKQKQHKNNDYITQRTTRQGRTYLTQTAGRLHSKSDQPQ